MQRKSCIILDSSLFLRHKIFVAMEKITSDDVQCFLEQFHEKMRIFGILYRDDRGKNQKALEELEIVPSFRKVVIENLKVEDYVEGPLVDELNKLGEMWVFGKDVKGREVYIKIMKENYRGEFSKVLTIQHYTPVDIMNF